MNNINQGLEMQDIDGINKYEFACIYFTWISFFTLIFKTSAQTELNFEIKCYLFQEYFFKENVCV